MNRRDFVNLSGAGLLSAATRVGEAEARVPFSFREDVAAPPATRQNMVIYVADEMRADALACYGNPVSKTPNFDRLAREGAMFENCHVQYPVCGASRCAMLTGWPTSVRGHRSLYYFLRPEEPNLFRYLRQAGYDVFWFGKNDALAAQSFHDSVTRWADSAAMRMNVQDLTPGIFSMLYSPGGDRRQTSDYTLLQMGLEVLARKESDRPFCIFLPLLQPHPPYTIPADFYAMFSADKIDPLVEYGLPRKPDFHEGIRSIYGLNKLPADTLRKIRAVYYGQVAYSDWLLGELLEALSKTGRDRDTSVFVTSDHGDYAGDYGLVEKWPSGLEDCLTRVPMVMRVPGAKAGVKATGMVEMFDLMQTCLDLAGTQAQHTHFSRSMVPVLHGGPSDLARASFTEGGYNVYEPQCFEPMGAGGGPYAGKIRLENEQPQMVSRSSMIRTGTHKLIMRPQGQSELYEYASDPKERHNRFGEASMRGVQAELSQKLLERYINTTGIAPFDKDPRDMPPYYPTPDKLTPADWQQKILG